MNIKFIFLMTALFLQQGAFGGRGASAKYSPAESAVPQEYSAGYNSDDLNGYGEWIYIDGYGRVWSPYVTAQWQPFADGRWVFDGNDWVWDSYEPYGAIVYHYGNWEYASNRRWVWIPNQTHWSPACVVWVYYGDQIAWAPRPRQGHAYGEPWEHNHHRNWVVVRNNDFTNDHVNKHRLTGATIVKGGRNAPISRTPPPVTYVQQHTPKPIPVRHDIVRNGKITPNQLHEKHPVPVVRNPAAPAKSPVRTTPNPVRNA